jgi:hypothetical protein
MKNYIVHIVKKQKKKGSDLACVSWKIIHFFNIIFPSYMHLKTKRKETFQIKI